jgi:hypothetical protein
MYRNALNRKYCSLMKWLCKDEHFGSEAQHHNVSKQGYRHNCHVDHGDRVCNIHRLYTSGNHNKLALWVVGVILLVISALAGEKQHGTL